MGVGVTNPFAGGLKASFGANVILGEPGPSGPSARISPYANEQLPTEGGEDCFDEDSPTSLRSGAALEALESPRSLPESESIDFGGAEGSFSEDLPTRTISPDPSALRHEGRSQEASPTEPQPRRMGSSAFVRPMPTPSGAPADGGFSEDQITTTRSVERTAEPSPDEETSALEDPRRGLSMARILFEEGAFERSLLLLEQLMERHGDIPGSAELLARCQTSLEAFMADQLGPTDALAIPLPAKTRLSDLDMDPRAAYLFSRIDGTMTIEDLLDISGMGRFETMRNLLRLRELGLVDFERSRRA
jgi:hypothetical protein